MVQNSVALHSLHDASNSLCASILFRGFCVFVSWWLCFVPWWLCFVSWWLCCCAHASVCTHIVPACVRTSCRRNHPTISAVCRCPCQHNSAPRASCCRVCHQHGAPPLHGQTPRHQPPPPLPPPHSCECTSLASRQARCRQLRGSWGCQRAQWCAPTACLWHMRCSRFVARLSRVGGLKTRRGLRGL